VLQDESVLTEGEPHAGPLIEDAHELTRIARRAGRLNGSTGVRLKKVVLPRRNCGFCGRSRGA